MASRHSREICSRSRHRPSPSPCVIASRLHHSPASLFGCYEVNPIRLALVGLGKIARDQHLPAIAANDRFVLAATASRNTAGVAGVPHARSLAELLTAGPAFDAVVLCTPPQNRYELATLALSHGLHVFLEKPPGATCTEVEILREQAERSQLSLLASWHSRFAPAVEPARTWLAERRIKHVTAVWHEDVRIWHPGQAWIWEFGGLGVFDPGVNALSILTRILPRPFFLARARLTFPSNRDAPIAANMLFRDTEAAEIVVDLDWRKAGTAVWDITVESDAGVLKLQRGGAMLSLPSGIDQQQEREYPALYAHFAKLVCSGRSDVDCTPLRLVADAFLCGDRQTVEAFD
jgi:D-galactose 1-dehydrogenase